MASTAKIIITSARLIKQSFQNRGKGRRRPDIRKIIWPFKVTFHAVTGFQEIKYERRGSIALANMIFVLLFAGQIFSFLETGFLFNYNRVELLNVYMQFMTSVAPFILWTIANWSICTLMNGEGRFSEIWICTAYCCMPLIFKTIPVAVVSNFLTRDEGAFLALIDTGVAIWVGLLLFVSNMIVHQYSFKKNVFSMVLTVFGITAILLLLILLFSLFQQLFTFFDTIISEILFRI
jgi:hypothetical protein